MNKIFEISGVQPLGVMVYGSLSYMGLPMEVLVKRYRRNFANGVEFDNVLKCAEHFAGYLEKHVPYDQDNENENVEKLIYYTIRLISGRMQKTFFSRMIQLGKFLPSKANGIYQEVIKEEIDRLGPVHTIALHHR